MSVAAQSSSVMPAVPKAAGDHSGSIITLVKQQHQQIKDLFSQVRKHV
jgi:hypothetical protein